MLEVGQIGSLRYTPQGVEKDCRASGVIKKGLPGDS